MRRKMPISPCKLQCETVYFLYWFLQKPTQNIVSHVTRPGPQNQAALPIETQAQTKHVYWTLTQYLRDNQTERRVKQCYKECVNKIAKTFKGKENHVLLLICNYQVFLLLILPHQCSLKFSLVMPMRLYFKLFASILFSILAATYYLYWNVGLECLCRFCGYLRYWCSLHLNVNCLKALDVWQKSLCISVNSILHVHASLFFSGIKIVWFMVQSDIRFFFSGKTKLCIFPTKLCIFPKPQINVKGTMKCATEKLFDESATNPNILRSGPMPCNQTAMNFNWTSMVVYIP